MKNKFARHFLWSAAVLIGLTAVAKLYSASGSDRLLTATDPILHLRYREVMVLVGIAELGTAAYLFFGKSLILRAFAVLWLGSNFVAYKAAAKYLNVEMCPCLGTLASSLPLDQSQINSILSWMVIYFLAGSSAILLFQTKADDLRTSNSVLEGAGVAEV